MEVTIYSGGVSSVATPDPKVFQKWEPRLFKPFGAMETISQMYEKSDPLPAIVHDWILGSGLVLMRTGSFHDGTMVFTLECVANLSQVAADYITEQGGSWECSHIYIERTSKPAPKSWMHHEQAYIALRRLVETEEPAALPAQGHDKGGE